MLKKISLISLLLLINLVAYADDHFADFSTNLTGDWFGRRSKLYNLGIEVQSTYIADALYNTRGGIATGGAALDNLIMAVSIDGEKLYNVEGAKAFISIFGGHGGKPNAKRIGSILHAYNTELVKPTIALAEAWLSQDILDGKFSILAGLYDLSTEFYATDSSGLFLQSTYGLGTEFAATGINGPSWSPITSLAVRVKIKPNEALYLQAAVSDAIPGDPNNPKGTHIHLKKKDGALLITEMGVTSDFGNYALGAWKYSNKFDDLANTTDEIVTRSHSYGGYTTAEKVLYKHDESSMITGFCRLGVASEAVNQLKASWSAGLVYSGFIPGRSDSQLGFAIAKAYLSKKYRQAQNNLGFETRRHETSLELTYADKLTPWLQIQPDLQYFFTPAMPANNSSRYLKDALVIGVRFTITF